MNNLITNSILNIKIDCNIDQNKFIRMYGGTFTKSLPAVRKIYIIENLRYTFLINKTGSIILSNFHPAFDLQSLFSFIFSLIYRMLEDSVAYTEKDELDVSFFVENFVFGASIDFSNSEYKSHSILNKTIFYESFDDLDFDSEGFDRFIECLKDLPKVLSVRYYKKDRFSANIVKIPFKRDWLGIHKYKSIASKKRQKSKLKIKSANEEELYEIQNCTIEIFRNGYLTITGSLCDEDFCNIFNIIKALLTEVFIKNEVDNRSSS